MPSVEVGVVSPGKPPSKKSRDKHDSKKRKRDVVNEGASDATDIKKRKGEEKKKERKKEKKGKSQAKHKNKDGKVKEKDTGGQTPTIKEEQANKNLKEKLQSMVIYDTESLVTEPLCSSSIKSDTGTPSNRYPAIAVVSTTPIRTSPLKPILKSPEKRMNTTKPPLETVDSNTGKANGTLPVPESALSKPRKPKKSVKFHSEAAAEDGESRQRIHNALIAAYKASETAGEVAVTPEELADSIEAPAKKRKREKKEKREKVKKGGKDENAKQSALSYMLEYHKSRETWKFQKAKQNWILRNAFDVTEIEGTKENDAALKAYVAGLQGQEARNRMLGEAKKCLKSEDGEMGEEKEKKISRAKLVMIGLGHESDEDEEENIMIKDDDEDEDDSEDEDSDDDDDE